MTGLKTNTLKFVINILNIYELIFIEKFTLNL